MRVLVSLALAGLAFSASIHAQEDAEPESIQRAESCRALFVRPPGEDLQSSARVARLCIVDACVAPTTRLPRTIEVDVRVRDRQVRARIVRGDLGSAEADRCAEAVLRRTPFPRGDTRRGRVQLTIERPMRISTPQIDEPPATQPHYQPDRNEVGRVMRAIRPRVEACGTDGVAIARFTFSSDGKVRLVRVTGIDDPQVVACIEGVLRDVRVRPFARNQFRVQYPFRL